MTTNITSIKLSHDFEEIFKIREEIVSEYSLTIKSVITTSDRLQLGTCLIIMKSIFNHLTALELLLEKCYIESAGSIATSLWEKSITLQYLILDIENRIKAYTTHDSFKKSPWPIKTMVTDIVKHENWSSPEKAEVNTELLYLQYSYLCAIKHGNPYTMSYLNRHLSNENIFQPEPIIDNEDKNILGFLYLYALTAMFDSLKAFSKKFCIISKYKELEQFGEQLTKNILQIKMSVPQIIISSPKDFRKEFLEYLQNLDKTQQLINRNMSGTQCPAIIPG